MVQEHVMSLRYRSGDALAAAENAFNQLALEMDASRRLKLEALCSRARALYLAGSNIAY